MDAFTNATWTGQRARQTAVRDRSMPVSASRDPIGHLPDPRTFDARAIRAGFAIITALQFTACAAVVGVVWALLA